ncbi:hypothetical protein AB0393_28390 [Streptomyces cyaneofuscatus]|uniref:hypothetical protein n=1 Tax=Streptomyces cyaneofuscatus TaxID=66883 RepID=UPI00344D7657
MHSRRAPPAALGGPPVRGPQDAPALAARPAALTRLTLEETLPPPTHGRGLAPPYTPTAGAERWDLRLARTLLEHTGLPDLDADSSASTGYGVGADFWRVQVIWMQNGSLTLPRAGTAARRRWDEALDGIQDALGSTQFTALRRNRYCVSAAAVVPEEPQCTARLRRVGPLDAPRNEVSFDGYGTAAAFGTVVLASHGPSPTSTLIVTDAEGAEVGRGYDSYQIAVESLAHHYGLPMPLALVDEGRGK